MRRVRATEARSRAPRIALETAERTRRWAPVALLLLRLKTATLVAMEDRRSFARLGLTLFAWGSALTVAACGALAWSGSEVAIMAAEPRMHSFGLLYARQSGAALAFAEAVLVLGAWWASRSRSSLARRVGAAALVAWALLWCVNALRWSQADAEPVTYTIVGVLALSLACAALTARAELRPERVPCAR